MKEHLVSMTNVMTNLMINFRNNINPNVNQLLLNNPSPGPFNMSTHLRERLIMTTGFLGFSHYCYFLFK
jgi:hypothetical protein